jgi:hypothetical protein
MELRLIQKVNQHSAKAQSLNIRTVPVNLTENVLQSFIFVGYNPDSTGFDQFSPSQKQLSNSTSRLSKLANCDYLTSDKKNQNLCRSEQLLDANWNLGDVGLFVQV